MRVAARHGSRRVTITRRTHAERPQKPSPRFAADEFFEAVAKLGLVGVLLVWSLVILRPFLSILLWSVILTVTLYPVFAWMARHIGSRKLAAAAVTAIALLAFTGPIIWLGMSLLDAAHALSEQISSGAITLPQPSPKIKTWPLIGDRLFQLWSTASADLKRALTEALPQLEPVRNLARKMIQGAAAGLPSFLISLVIAGFLFTPAPNLLITVRKFAQRITPSHGQEYLELAGITIRNVSQGVIGIAVAQALLAGLGFVVAGIPASGLLAIAVLIFAIVQLPGIVLLPVIIWSWLTMSYGAAFALSAYLVAVALLNNVLSPIVMAHGLKTPTLVIFAGVIGGALVHGVLGLFLGPIILAVTWELGSAWLSGGNKLLKGGGRQALN